MNNQIYCGDTPTLKEIQKRYTIILLRIYGGNETQVAKALGINRRTLYRWVKKYGLK